MELHTDWRGTVKNYTLRERLSGAHHIEFTFQLKGIHYREGDTTYFRWRALPFSWSAPVENFRGTIKSDSLGELQCWTSEAEEPKEADLCELEPTETGAAASFTPEYGEPVRYKVALEEAYSTPKTLPWPAQADGSFGRSLTPLLVALVLSGGLVILLRARQRLPLLRSLARPGLLRVTALPLAASWLLLLAGVGGLPTVLLLPLAVIAWYLLPSLLLAGEGRLYSLTAPEDKTEPSSEESSADEK